MSDKPDPGDDWMTPFYQFQASQDWMRDKLAALAANLVAAGHAEPHIGITCLAAEQMVEQIGHGPALAVLETLLRRFRNEAAGRRPE